MPSAGQVVFPNSSIHIAAMATPLHPAAVPGNQGNKHPAIFWFLMALLHVHVKSGAPALFYPQVALLPSPTPIAPPLHHYPQLTTSPPVLAAKLPPLLLRPRCPRRRMAGS